MNSIQGVIACSGRGYRFARSVGKDAPYPKHLERLGDRSVLRHALDGLVRYIPISGVIVTLNPDLQELYLDHLKEIEPLYPGLELSYLVSSPTPENESFLDGLRNDLDKTRRLDGERLEFADPIVAVAFGDQVIAGGDSNKIQHEVTDFLPKLREGYVKSIRTDGFWSGILYEIGRVRYLSGYETWSTETSYNQQYRMRCWNINTTRDLAEAKRDLGYPLTEGELNMISGPRREAFR